MGKVDFCTCKDHTCPLNQVNHDKGCSSCIEKNLNDDEIPSCFFIKVNGELKGIKDFSIDGFATVVKKKTLV